MQKYELLYIIPSQFADTEIDAVAGRVEALVEKAGAKIFRKGNLGKIKLAYPIKHTRHGTYMLIYFEADTTVLKEVDKLLRLADEVLRHQVIVMTKAAEDKKYEIHSYVPPLSEEGRPVKSERKKKPAIRIAPPTPATVEPPLSIEELDKKLDEILDKDITENI